MCVHTQCQAFQVDHIWFCLFALNIFIPTSPHAKYAQSCLHEYAHIRAIIPACIYAQTGTIMPARICKHRCEHACKHMYTCAQSFAHVYAHIGVNMPAKYMYTCAQSFAHVYAHIGENMPANICTHVHNHLLTYTHTWGQSCLQEYVHMLWARISRFSEHTQLSAFVHHLAARPESLGVVAWLLHCCSLAFCAQGMAVSRPSLIVVMNTQT
jgi:hypothetical protein